MSVHLEKKVHDMWFLQTTVLCLMSVVLVIVQDYFVVICDAVCLGRRTDISKNHFTLKMEVC